MAYARIHREGISHSAPTMRLLILSCIRPVWGEVPVSPYAGIHAPHPKQVSAWHVTMLHLVASLCEGRPVYSLLHLVRGVFSMHSCTACCQDAAPESQLFVGVCRQHNAQSGYVLANQQYIY